MNFTNDSIYNGTWKPEQNPLPNCNPYLLCSASLYSSLVGNAVDKFSRLSYDGYVDSSSTIFTTWPSSTYFSTHARETTVFSRFMNGSSLA